MDLSQLTSPDAAELCARARIGVIVCGATEQHGPHLPLSADTICAWSLATELAKMRPLVLAPAVPFGCSSYHAGWPGTLSIATDTLAAIVVDLTRSLARNGIGNVLLLNGHGGNRLAVDLAAQRIADARIATVAVAYLQGVAYRAAEGKLDLGHGGRIETSIVLASAPQLVKLDRAVGGDDLQESLRRERSYSARDVYRPLIDWADIAPAGWFGDAAGASREEGERLIATMAARVSRYLDEVFPG